MFSLILYAPKHITHVQTVISEHDRNGAKWEVGHIAIYLTKKRVGVGNWGMVYAEAAAKGKGFLGTKIRSCVFLCVSVGV